MNCILLAPMPHLKVKSKSLVAGTRCAVTALRLFHTYAIIHIHVRMKLLFLDLLLFTYMRKAEWLTTVSTCGTSDKLWAMRMHKFVCLRSYLKRLITHEFDASRLFVSPSVECAQCRLSSSKRTTVAINILCREICQNCTSTSKDC